MFEKIGRAAEQAATGLSRRGFLGWAGQGALAVASALALGSVAEAASRQQCCVYRCVNREGRYTVYACGRCDPNSRCDMANVACKKIGLTC